MHYLWIILAAIAMMWLWALWYWPLFGKQYMKFMGYKPEEMEEKQKGMWMAYAMTFIFLLITAGILYHLLWALEITSYIGGIRLAILLWLWWVVPTMYGFVSWQDGSMGIFKIGFFYQLIWIILMTLIILSF